MVIGPADDGWTLVGLDEGDGDVVGGGVGVGVGMTVGVAGGEGIGGGAVPHDVTSAKPNAATRTGIPLRATTPSPLAAGQMLS